VQSRWNAWVSSPSLDAIQKNIASWRSLPVSDNEPVSTDDVVLVIALSAGATRLIVRGRSPSAIFFSMFCALPDYFRRIFLAGPRRHADDVGGTARRSCRASR